MHNQFVTTTRGLRREAPIMRLYEKAKRLGIWNPSDIDFSQDARDWAGLDDLQRDLILRLTASFVAGEEAVTLDILPLIMTVAREGRVEEELERSAEAIAEERAGSAEPATRRDREGSSHHAPCH